MKMVRYLLLIVSILLRLPKMISCAIVLKYKQRVDREEKWNERKIRKNIVNEKVHAKHNRVSMKWISFKFSSI